MTVRSRFARHLLTTTLTMGVLFAGAMESASAQTLQEALAQAYASNPALGAQRARQRAVDESVPQALSGYRPTVRATANVGRNITSQDVYSRSAGASATIGTQVNPKSVGLSATQPLYDATVGPAVRRAERTVEAQRASTLATEQQTLLTAATAYLDVVQNQALLQLQANNEQVLRRQLDAARDRFRVGEYTRTDVSQSESRLAASIASRITAEGTLQASRAAYERTVGSMPGNLKAPKPNFKLPATLDEVVEMARANNPSVLAASYTEQAQREAVDQQFGRLLPSANLSAQAQRSWDASTSSGIDTRRLDSAQFTAQVTIPLYQAGLPEALTREAKHTANQARLQIEDARAQSVQSAISAWQGLQAARASIESFNSQIRAAEIALEGVRQEAQVGSRTVLDVLNQEQELLNARVNLVQAQRNEMVQAFTVLGAIGQLTARQLSLPVQYYNPDTHYQQVRNKWTGTGVPE
ncbi:TolC family outer membrane protein [Azospirillum canadense]|uniref:TolC family outer membrane protein n=1 Tax=Azospirillum canadense TaxID=403962 RepID=UPI002226EEDB|nr:TolC family outer membrane protein [Azospirillum canadense]MCW2237031.1 outer membrane protein/adhesin transport system outer membrane protein [Azospirillum canadense]